MGMGLKFLAERTHFPGAHKIGAAISGPRIARKKFYGHEDFSDNTGKGKAHAHTHTHTHQSSWSRRPWVINPGRLLVLHGESPACPWDKPGRKGSRKKVTREELMCLLR